MVDEKTKAGEQPLNCSPALTRYILYLEIIIGQGVSERFKP